MEQHCQVGDKKESAVSLHGQQVYPNNQVGNKDCASSHTQGREIKTQFLVTGLMASCKKELKSLTFSNRGKNQKEIQATQLERQLNFSWIQQFLGILADSQPNSEKLLSKETSCYRPLAAVMLILRRQLIMQNESVTRHSHITSSRWLYEIPKWTTWS